MPLDPRIKVRRSKGEYKIKKFSVVDNFSSAEEFLVPNASVDNLARAVCERMMLPKVNGVYKPPLRPNKLVLADLRELIFAEIRPHIRRMSPYPRSKIPTLYTGRKRTLYANAEDTLETKPLVAEDWEVRCFGKADKLNCSVKALEDIIQRVIQGQSVRYNVELACFIKPMENAMYEAIDKMFNAHTGAPDTEKTILKGMNCEKVAEQIKAKHDRFSDPVFVPLDAVKYDAHTSNEMQEIEHELYCLFFNVKKDRTRLRWLLEKQLKVKGKGFCFDGVVKYVMKNIRMSGCMNTGSGNNAIMAMCIRKFMAEVGISNYAAGINGDDAFLIVERRDLMLIMDRVHDCFKQYGYNMEVGKPVSDMEELEFCQTHPVFDGIKWRMVRDPRKSCTKDTISIHPFNSVKDWVSYMDSVGNGGLSATAGIPMMQSYYLSYVRIAQENAPKGYDFSKRKIEQTQEINGFYYMRKGMNEKVREITVEARVSFWKAFGITPDVQIFMEQQYSDIRQTWKGPKVAGRPGNIMYHYVKP